MHPEIMVITVMIITIMLIPPVYAGFTTRTCMAAITMIITPIHTGTIRIHGITDSAFIWVITGGELALESDMTHGIPIHIMVMDMVTDIRIMDMVMGVDMVAVDTTITIIPVITTVMTITPLTTDIAALLPAQEAVRV